MTANQHGEERMPRIVIIGGGIAGVEAAMAIGSHLRGLVEMTLVSPEPELVIKPLVVEEPFTGEPAERHELRPLLAEVGCGFRLAAATAIDTERRVVRLDDGGELHFDHLIVCVGAKGIHPYRQAKTFWAGLGDVAIDELIARAAHSERGNLALLIPPRTTWSLPMYELAFMTRSRADQLGHRDLRIEIYTPEQAPLAVFGSEPSRIVGELLGTRRIRLVAGSGVIENEVGALLTEAGEPVRAGAYLALPRLVGPRIAGLPTDEEGFILTDERAGVVGLEDIWAAGDGTDFPIKQGGLAAHQADVAAENIAAALGAESAEPQTIEPVLRGQLIVGGETINMIHSSDAEDAGRASLDPLWSHARKVTARYLTARLTGTEPTEPETISDEEARRIYVDASWPHEWHGQPLGSW